MPTTYEHTDHDEAQTDQDNVDRVGELIKDIRTCMLATHDDQDRLVSRPMTTVSKDFDGDVWFFVSMASETAAQIRADHRVNVAYASDSGWVSLSGDADVLHDVARNEDLWNPFVEVYFQNGPADPDVGLIRVHAHGAQYWDAPGKVGQVLGMVKARVTHSEPEIGESHTVEF